MQGWLKHAYEKLAPYGLRQDIKGYTRRRHYAALRQGTDAKGYSLKPYDDLRCVFVHIPKNAGVSLCNALFGCLGGGHLTARTYRAIFGVECYDSYFKFAFVRNPWDRLVSAYTFLKKGGLNGQDEAWAREHLAVYPDFKDFVKRGLNPGSLYEKLHFIPQWEYLVNRDGKIAMDFLGRFETLEDDFDQVAKRLRVAASLPRANASPRGDYRSYYDDASAEIVARLYARDIELFRYSFEGGR
jgi:hypothetical protein